MSNYNLSSKEVSERTGYSIRTVQSLAVFFTQYNTRFAIKDENGDWFFDERAVAMIILVKNRIVPNDVELSKLKALELLNGIIV